MALRIQTNIAAINAHKNLNASDVSMAKSLERLSSGYRINRAADDAAGLSIASGFRADIASFKVASRNTSEANALLQVAEGGMEQIENMLTRLKELATQASSANVGSTERSKINAEGNALISEIDRLAQSTKYGSTALLDGTFGASMTAGTYSGGGTNIRAYGDLTHVYSVVSAVNASGIVDFGLTITALGSTVCAGTWTFSAANTDNFITIGNGSVTETASVTWNTSTSQTVSFVNLGLTFTINSTAAAGATAAWCGTTIVLRDTGVTSLNVVGADSGTYAFTTAAAGSITLGNGTATQTISGISPGTAQDLNFNLLGVTFHIGTEYTENDLENSSFIVESSGSGSTFQIGAENNANNRISLSISSVRATATTGLSLSYNYLDSATEAQSMLDLVDSALSTITSRRGDIGASMNRLSYAAANLATTIENNQAAESVIRDVDMASEMTNFTKQQILMQAGTAMLAQANQAPSLILSLIGQ